MAPSWYHSERGVLTSAPFIRIHLSNSTLIAISNQPVPWQQLGAFRPVDVVKTTCCKPGVRKVKPTRGERSYFSDSECRKVVCVSWAGLRFSKCAGFSLATISWLIEKYTIMQSHRGRHSLLVPEVGGGCFKMTVTVSPWTFCCKQGIL